MAVALGQALRICLGELTRIIFCGEKRNEFNGKKAGVD